MLSYSALYISFPSAAPPLLLLTSCRRKGKTAGLTAAQIEALSVDWDRKNFEDPAESSEDEDESRTVPTKPADEEELVEYIDDLGRTRLAPKGEVPRYVLEREEREAEAYVFLFLSRFHVLCG
jgi:hypothetical protein